MDRRGVFGTNRPVVGMVHLPPLPGAPGYGGDRTAVHDRAQADAEALVAGGVDAVLVENFGDAPFYPDDVPKHVVASMTDVTRTVHDAVGCPVGVNVLRNDVEAALSVAAATGSAFVRVNVHTGARLTDQGIVEGRPHETMRLRDRLDADVAVLADLDVKHSAPLAGGRDESDSIAETAGRGLADGVIVSGPATGQGPPLHEVEDTVATRDEFAPDTPVFVGSGVTPDNAGTYLDVADGVIVGTALKEGGRPSNPVDQARVESLIAASSG